MDSQAVIYEAMGIVFCRFGYPEPAPAATRSVIGLTLDLAIATIMGREIDSEIQAMALEYREVWIELSVRQNMKCRPYEGMAALVRSLAGREDCLLGIVTGKSRRGVEELMSSADFGNCFVTSRCADDCPSKPHPAMVLECCGETGIHPTSTLVIGDTSFDAEMARAAGARMIGVSWGYHPVPRLREAGAELVAGSPAHLAQAIQAWGRGIQEATRPAALLSLRSTDLFHHA